MNVTRAPRQNPTGRWPRGWQLLVVVVTALLAFVLACGVALAWWAGRGLLPWMVGRVADAAQAQVQLERGTVDLGPRIRLHAHGLQVARRDGSGDALQVAEAWADLPAADALGSGMLRVGTLHLRGVKVVVERRVTGTWTVVEAADELRLAISRVVGGDAGEPLRWAVDRVVIQDAEVAVTDRVHDVAFTARQLSADATDVRVGAPLDLRLRTLVDHAGTTAEADVQVRLAALPGQVPEALPEGLHAEVTLRGVPLVAAAGLVPESWLSPRAGTADLHLGAHASVDGQGLDINGLVTLQGLVLGTPSERGSPVDLRVAWDVTARPGQHVWEVRGAEVTGPALRADASFTLDPAAMGGVRRVQVRANVDDLSRALAVFPAGWMAASGLEFAGPAAVLVEGDASGGRVRVDADQARLHVGRWLDKAAGRPGRVRADYALSDTSVRLSAVEVAVGPVLLAGRGTLALGTGGSSVLGLDTGAIPVSRLAEVVPALREQPGARLPRGAVRVRVQLEDPGGRPTLDAAVELAGLDASWTDAYRARGDALVSLAVRPEGDAARWRAEVNLDALSVQRVDATGGTTALKVPGLPAHVRAEGTRAPGHVRAERVLLEVGNLKAHAHGELRGDGQHRAWDVVFERFTATAADVKGVLPDFAVLPPRSRVEAGGRWQGDTRDPTHAVFTLSGLRVEAPHLRADADVAFTGLEPVHVGARVDVRHVEGALLDFTGGPAWLRPVRHAEARVDVVATVGAPSSAVVRVSGARVRADGLDASADAELKDLVAPRVSADVTVKELDLAALPVRTSRDVRLPAMPLPLRALVDRAEVDARVKLVRVTGAREPLRDFSAHVVMRHCLARLKSASGHLGERARVDARGTRVHVCGDVARAHVRLVVEDVEVGTWMARDGWRPVEGDLDAVVDVDLEGATAREVEQSAEGSVQFHVPELVLHEVDLLKALRVGETDLAQVTRQVEPARQVEPLVIYGVTGRATLDDGLLRLDAPLDQPTSFGRLQLDGWLAVDETLQMQGSAVLTEEAVRRITGGRYRPGAPVRTPIRLLGRVGDIQVLDVDPRAFVRDSDVPAMVEAARGAARETQEQLEKRAARDAERLRQQVEQDRRAVEEDMRRRLDRFRALVERRRDPAAPEDADNPQDNGADGGAAETR